MNETLVSPGTVPGTALNPIVMLDYLFPGFTMLADFLQANLGINLNLYLPVLLSLSFVAAAWRYLSSYITDLVETHLMSVVDIRTDDEIYNMLMGWVAQQTFSQGARRFVANTNLNSRMYWWMWRDDDSDDEDGTESKKKKKTLAYTPTFGSHWFIYKRRVLVFKRQQPSTQSPFYTTSEREEISISCFGRNPWVLKELLNEARQMYLKRDEAKTLIYRGALKGPGLEPTWQRCMARTSRPFSTVILNEEVKKKLIDDVTDYLNPATRRWYANRGIPYRRGYLLWGPPGTGKSSLSLALAGFFKMRIYIVSLSSITATEENLASLFAELPRRCVVLLEDIDTAGLTHTREENRDGSSPSSPSSSDPSTTAATVVSDPKSPGGSKSVPIPGRLSLSGLLNILDGVASQEGRVLIMTTNHIEKLDKALIRPGRVDMQVKFDRADRGMTTAIFRAIYAPLEEDEVPPSTTTATPINSPALAALENKLKQFTPSTATTTPPDDKQQQEEEEEKERRKQEIIQKVDSLARQFAEKVPPLEFSPAEIQGFLLKNKRNPEQAVAGVEEWLVVARQEQKERELEQQKKKEEELEKAAKKAAKKEKKKAAAAKKRKAKKGKAESDGSDEENSATESDASDVSEQQGESEDESSKKKGKKSIKEKKTVKVEIKVDTPPLSGSEEDDHKEKEEAVVPEKDKSETVAPVVVAAPTATKATTITIDTKKANKEEVEKPQMTADSGYGATPAEITPPQTVGEVAAA